jgi:hypothetical protein
MAMIRTTILILAVLALFVACDSIKKETHTSNVHENSSLRKTFIADSLIIDDEKTGHPHLIRLVRDFKDIKCKIELIKDGVLKDSIVLYDHNNFVVHYHDSNSCEIEFGIRGSTQSSVFFILFVRNNKILVAYNGQYNSCSNFLVSTKDGKELHEEYFTFSRVVRNPKNNIEGDIIMMDYSKICNVDRATGEISVDSSYVLKNLHRDIATGVYYEKMYKPQELGLTIDSATNEQIPTIMSSEIKYIYKSRRWFALNSDGQLFESY